MRRVKLSLMWVLPLAVSTLGACGITDRQFGDFVTSTGLHVILQSALTALSLAGT